MLGPAKRAPTTVAAPPGGAAAVAASEVKRLAAIKPCSKHAEAYRGILNSQNRHDNGLLDWIETDSIDGEVSQLVEARSKKAGRRCCRHSTSSGYSSHSPPLSAASYAIAPAAAAVGATPKGLAVIREGEIIPRPIWPSPPDSTGDNSPTDSSSSDAERDANRQSASIYGSAGYRSGSSDYSGGEIGGTAHSNSSTNGSAMSTRELLVELSRTLNLVLEGGSAKSDEDILRDITRTVAKGTCSAGSSKAGRSIYEEIYRNSSLTSSGKDSSSTIAVNPINSRLYGNRCFCERKSFLYHSHPSSSQQASPKSNGRKEQCTPTVFLLPDLHTKSYFQDIEKNFASCNCKNYKTSPCNSAQKILNSQSLGKQTRNQSDLRGNKDIRFNYPSIVENEYTTLECSDESTSSEGVTDSSVKGDTWCKDFRGFDKNLDFTLDGLRAERLGRAIARAKRRRQWCRAFVIIVGLVFFVLSVVVVTMSVTRGRKVFGSM